MEHYIEQVNIESDKISDNIRISAFSDLHLKEKERDIIYIRSIIKKISDLHPDYITGLGDYYYGHKKEKYKMQDSLVYLLHGLREIAPVIMSLGNHDISVDNEYELRKSFRDLESHNIYPLDNESVEFDDIYFSGYFEKRDLLSFSKKMISDDSRELNLKTYEDKFGVLLCHNPFSITSATSSNNIPNINEYDLILSGHCHNGLLSLDAEKKIASKIDMLVGKLKTKGDYDQIVGLLESLKSFGVVIRPIPFTRYARGLHDINDTKLFISRGVTSQSKNGDSFVSEVYLVRKLNKNKSAQNVY